MNRVKSGGAGAFRTLGNLAAGLSVLLASSVLAALPTGDTARAPALPGAGSWSQAVLVADTLALDFQPMGSVSLTHLDTVRTPVTRLDLNLAQPSALTWSVTPTGTRVTVGQNQHAVLINGLTSRRVRPQAIVADEARGAVWLYGDDLYRYRAATGELVRFQTAADRLGSIRKVVADANGVWLATDNGVYRFDDVKEQFSVVDHPLLSAQPIVQAVSADGAVWFVTQPSRLIRLTLSDADHVQLRASRRLPLGVVAEMLSVRGTLWLMSSRDNGEYYEVGYVDAGGERLMRVAGKYYALRAVDGQVLAATRRSMQVFDAAGASVTTLDFDSSRALRQSLKNGKVLFMGTSYAVKDNCEVVEHRRVDVSKGWTTPDLDFFVPGVVRRAPPRGAEN